MTCFIRLSIYLSHQLIREIKRNVYKTWDRQVFFAPVGINLDIFIQNLDIFVIM